MEAQKEGTRISSIGIRNSNVRLPTEGGDGGGPRVDVGVASGDGEACPGCGEQMVKARACVFCVRSGYKSCDGF